jgi:hypothetical protein
MDSNFRLFEADEQDEEEAEVAAEEQAQEPKFNKHITPGSRSTSTNANR